MDVPLAVLRDTVTTPSGGLRCAVLLTDAGGTGTFTMDDGTRVPYSRRLICRAGSAPSRLAVLTVRGVSCVAGAVRVHDTTGPWMRHAVVYCTTRSDVTGDLPDTVVFYPSVSSTDTYGTVRRSPGVVGLTMPGRVAPTSAREDERDGQRREQSWTVTVDGDLLASGVDAYSVMAHAGVRYALNGDPLVRTDGVGGSWSTVSLRRVGPGTV